LLPNVEATATNLARVLRLHPHEGGETSFNRASVVRRLLEELGVRCDETATLQDLKGFLLSSRRGTEIVTCKDLSDDERVQVYAHLVAHTLLDPDADNLQLLARFEYMPGRAPDGQSAHEEHLADAVAQAILDGRLEAAPRLVYCHDLGPGRGRLSRAVLRGLHRSSLALYRRSRSYQRLRSWRMFTAVTLRVHSFLGSAA
jgi:hypothetical protein